MSILLTLSIGENESTNGYLRPWFCQDVSADRGPRLGTDGVSSMSH